MTKGLLGRREEKEAEAKSLGGEGGGTQKRERVDGFFWFHEKVRQGIIKT